MVTFERSASNVTFEQSASNASFEQVASLPAAGADR